MKRFLAVAIVIGSLNVVARVHAEDNASPQPKHCPTAPPAPHAENRDLFESTANDIGLIKKDAAKALSPSEQTTCLLMAADLAELGGLDKEAKRLRDEAAKDQPPTGILDLLTRRQAQLDALQSQVAALRRLTHTEQQVLVDVRMIEISRTKMREAGLKLPTFDATAKLAAKNSSQPVQNSLPGGVLGVVNPDHELFATLDDFKSKGIARVLAEPTLATLSGRPAFFASGGEFPYLRREHSEEPTVEFKRFGIQVDLLALTLGDDKLRLEVKTRFSELCDRLSVETDGLKVPGLNVRECDTAVELKSGQTVVVGRLSQKNGPSSARKDPTEPGPSKSAEPAEVPPDTELLILLRARTVEAPSQGLRNHASSSASANNYGLNK